MRVSKYRSQKTVIDGITFASKLEASRYQELKLEQIAGVISNLRWQVPFKIGANGRKICAYIADFVYDKHNETVVEDVKSAFTQKNPVYGLKKKMMFALLDISISEWPVIPKKTRRKS